MMEEEVEEEVEENRDTVVDRNLTDHMAEGMAETEAETEVEAMGEEATEEEEVMLEEEVGEEEVEVEMEVEMEVELEEDLEEAMGQPPANEVLVLDILLAKPLSEFSTKIAKVAETMATPLLLTSGVRTLHSLEAAGLMKIGKTSCEMRHKDRLTTSSLTPCKNVNCLCCK
jgi:hypothetical protein